MALPPAFNRLEATIDTPAKRSGESRGAVLGCSMFLSVSGFFHMNGGFPPVPTAIMGFRTAGLYVRSETTVLFHSLFSL